MSAAAVLYAQTVPVKGSARALLDVIAELIPEGETMTAPISTEELTARMTGYGDAAARRARRRLVTMGVLRIVDDRPGHAFCYELPHLPGARGPHPPLPLIGEAAPPPRARRVRPPEEGPTLFDRPSAEGVQNVHPPLTGLARCVRFVRAPAARLLKNLKVRANKVYERYALSDQPAKTGVQNVRAIAPLSSREDLVGVDARAREPAEDFLDWFEHTYPTVHHGAVCTVRRARDGPLVRELLQRPRTDVAHVQAMTRYLWDVTTDGVVKSDRWWIAERVTVRDVFVLHRKADFLDQAVRLAERSLVIPNQEPDAEDLAAYATLFRDAIDARLTRRDLETWIIPLVVIPAHDGVVLCAPSEIHATYIRKNFAEALEAATQTAFRCAAEVIVRPSARGGVGRNSG